MYPSVALFAKPEALSVLHARSLPSMLTSDTVKGLARFLHRVLTSQVRQIQSSSSSNHLAANLNQHRINVVACKHTNRVSVAS